jgi:hypothetical protein
MLGHEHGRDAYQSTRTNRAKSVATKLVGGKILRAFGSSSMGDYHFTLRFEGDKCIIVYRDGALFFEEYPLSEDTNDFAILFKVAMVMQSEGFEISLDL